MFLARRARAQRVHVGLRRCAAIGIVGIDAIGGDAGSIRDHGAGGTFKDGHDPGIAQTGSCMRKQALSGAIGTGNCADKHAESRLHTPLGSVVASTPEAVK